jgi:hypothetical protein
MQLHMTKKFERILWAKAICATHLHYNFFLKWKFARKKKSSSHKQEKDILVYADFDEMLYLQKYHTVSFSF